MSQPIKVRFSNFLNEIEQMEENNKTLKEDLEVLEKEKTEGYSKFNTDTHILIEREMFSKLEASLEDAAYSCKNTQDDATGLESCANDTYNNAGYELDDLENAQEVLHKLLKEVETAK